MEYSVGPRSFDGFGDIATTGKPNKYAITFLSAGTAGGK
jgi:hypothetical protein